MPFYSALFHNDYGLRKFEIKARVKRTRNHRFAEMKSAFWSVPVWVGGLLTAVRLDPGVLNLRLSW